MTIRSLSKRSLFVLSLLSALSVTLSGCSLLAQFEAELEALEQGDGEDSATPASEGEGDGSDGDAGGLEPCADDDDIEEDETPEDVPPWTPPPPPRDCLQGEWMGQEIILRTQQEAEEFAATYSSANIITIQGQDLTDLDALRCLQEVNQLIAVDTGLERIDLPSATMVRRLILEENGQLSEVSLPLAEEVWDLRVNFNPQLATLRVPSAQDRDLRTWIEGNEELMEVDLRSVTEGRGVVVRQNPSLRRFDMSSLVETGSIEFSDTGLEGSLDLSSLEALGGHLQFRRNDSLREVRLEHLIETGQEIVFDDHASLQTIRLDSLATAPTNTLFRDNRQLSEIHLPQLTYQGKALGISSNDRLTSVQIPGLRSVGDPDTSGYLRSTLHIENNPQLSEIAFDSLVAVGCRLRIVDNDELIDLNGFSSLRIVRGNLRLEGNRMLQDMSGLYGMESIGMAAFPIGPDAGNFLVRDNPRMPIEQAENLAYDIVGEDNIGGDIILVGVPFGGDF